MCARMLRFVRHLMSEIPGTPLKSAGCLIKANAKANAVKPIGASGFCRRRARVLTVFFPTRYVRHARVGLRRGRQHDR